MACQLTATDSWHQTLEEGADICAVFLDLSKAFDKVSHRLLMDKLVDLAINPSLLRWLKDYLTNWSQFVVINEESSGMSSQVSLKAQS